MAQVECRVMNASGNRFAVVDIRDYPDYEMDSLTQDKIVSACKVYNTDGLVFITFPQHPDCHAKMLYWNKDGSGPYMCGNAIRCVAKMVMDKLDTNQCTIESPQGIPHPAWSDEFKIVKQGTIQIGE